MMHNITQCGILILGRERTTDAKEHRQIRRSCVRDNAAEDIAAGQEAIPHSSTHRGCWSVSFFIFFFNSQIVVYSALGA